MLYVSSRFCYYLNTTTAAAAFALADYVSFKITK